MVRPAGVFLMIKKIYRELVCLIFGHETKTLVFRAENFEITYKACIRCGYAQQTDFEEIDADIVDLDESPKNAK
jgi:Zn ribbon nucleic-acid-binding protein